MSDNEIREMLISRKKAEARKEEKELKAEMNREVIKLTSMLIPAAILCIYVSTAVLG